MKKKILFLCTANSCRSQMAEGWAKHLWGDRYEFYSAGTVKSKVNPNAIRVMTEVEVDLTEHESKRLDELPTQDFDFVFTVCSNAQENCPIHLGKKNIHVGFDDPPELTKDMTIESEKLVVYRRVRDEIKSFILDLEKFLTPAP